MAQIPPVPYQSGMLEANGLPSQPWAALFRQMHQALSGLSVAKKTAAYTADLSDDVILCTASGGAFTVTLMPAGARTGKVLTIKKTDSSGNAVTIDGSGIEKIDGATTRALSTQYASLTVMSDGANWLIVGYR